MNLCCATLQKALLAAVVVAVVAQSALPLQAVGGRRAGRVSADESAWLERLKTWSDAVTRHVPGQADAAVLELAAWTADDVKSVVSDFLAMVPHLRRASVHAASLQVEHKKARLTTDELRRMTAFRDPGVDGINQVLRRAAMLHADVALLAALDFSRSTATPDTVQVLDGVIVGYEGQSAHWAAGRQLLDSVAPEPAADTFVRLWYHAVAAGFLEAGNLSAAKPHLEHAVDVLPADANVQYESGYYHQASSAPSIQAVVLMTERAQVRLSRSRSYSVAADETTEAHRKAAERRLRQAITLDPSHAEARVRLGMALLQLNRVEDAATQLRQAVARWSLFSATAWTPEAGCVGTRCSISRNDPMR